MADLLKLKEGQNSIINSQAQNLTLKKWAQLSDLKHKISQVKEAESYRKKSITCNRNQNMSRYSRAIRLRRVLGFPARSPGT